MVFLSDDYQYIILPCVVYYSAPVIDPSCKYFRMLTLYNDTPSVGCIDTVCFFFQQPCKYDDMYCALIFIIAIREIQCSHCPVSRLSLRIDTWSLFASSLSINLCRTDREQRDPFKGRVRCALVSTLDAR
ncbi:hypothetical protein BDR04DRAFT_1193488 [Suillus decipiens]|nr:hypothetical protein BDR04DRAFT_1193488 [Suillus decipiens]